MELGLRASNVARASQDYVQFYDPRTSIIYDTDIRTKTTDYASYVQPSLALVFDNSISQWVGPIMGRRSRFQYAPAFGSWNFHEFVGDYRRYDRVGSVTLATRAMFTGRFGQDTDQYRYFLGFTDFVRGYTAASLQRNECLSTRPGELIFCDALEQLIGSRIGVVNAELRFPLIQDLSLGILPLGFPPIEGAIFFDAGMAWNNGNRVVWRRAETDNLRDVRQPLKSWGFSIRANMAGILILRVEHARPLDRGSQGGYWMVSVGPTF
jgi:outer membrane protein assembly factor BamA